MPFTHKSTDLAKSWRTRLLEDVAISISWATLFFLAEWLNLFGDATAYADYEMPYRYPVIFPALMTCIFGVASIIFLLLRRTKKNPTSTFSTLTYLLLLALLFFPLNAVRVYTGLSITFTLLSWERLTDLRHPYLDWGSLGVIATLALAWVFIRGRNVIAAVVRVTGCILVPAVLVLFGNFIKLWIQNRDVPYLLKGLAIAKQKNPPPVHVVWVIFDELDRRLVFDERPKNLKLPEFDRLVSESISFSKAYPPAGNTIESIPGLLTGEALQFAKFESNDILLKANLSGENVRLSTAKNVFGETKKLGYQTGVVGWFHPYCNIFKGQLDACYRHSRARFDYSRHFFSNLRLILRRSIVISNLGKYLHIDDVNRLTAGAIKIAANSDFGLSFIHLPVPHAPWIYSKNTHQIDLTAVQGVEGYFDNVALADEVFGELRSAMEKSGAWEKSVVIVSSDHGWRISNAYDGKKDQRVPLIIHIPNGIKKQVDHLTPTYLTEPFVLAMLEQKLKNTDEIVNWFQSESKGYEPNPSHYKPSLDEE